MKYILIILFFATATVVAAPSIKFIIKHDKRITHAAKIKPLTREMWVDDSNPQLPEDWANMPEEGLNGRIAWCYNGWGSNVVNSVLSSTNCDVYCISPSQIAHYMTSNKWTTAKTQLLPQLKHGKDYVLEITE